MHMFAVWEWVCISSLYVWVLAAVSSYLHKTFYFTTRMPVYATTCPSHSCMHTHTRTHTEQYVSDLEDQKIWFHLTTWMPAYALHAHRHTHTRIHTDQHVSSGGVVQDSRRHGGAWPSWDSARSLLWIRCTCMCTCVRLTYTRVYEHVRNARRRLASWPLWEVETPIMCVCVLLDLYCGSGMCMHAYARVFM